MVDEHKASESGQGDRHADGQAVLTPAELRQEVAGGLILDILQERRSERRWKRFRRIAVAAMVLVGALLYVASYAGLLGYRMLPVKDTVAVIPINGTIAMGAAASADAVNPVLRRLFEAEQVRGIVLLINSGGGSPSEAERITRLLDTMRAQTGKPVYAACSGMCASAAYMIAMHTDRIFAGEYSWTGSIGAIMKGWDLQAILERVDIDQRVFASGDMKDLMNPFKAMTPEMASKLEALVNKSADSFIAEVKERRGAKLDPGADLFTGEVWTARDSLEYGLIDELGTLEDVVSSQFGDLPTKVYEPKRRKNSFFESIMSEVALLLKDELVSPTMELEM